MFKLPDLPFDLDALAPNVSERALDFHYNKHHAGYVDKLNDAIEGTDLEGETLETIIRRCVDDDILNNAAQAWNHAFYWHCMAPESTEPGEALTNAVNAAFGSFDALKERFIDVAGDQFGSGWGWLVQDQNGDLQITSSENAGNPMVGGCKPLLVTDVWEHAYYLDYQNERGEYLEKFWELVDWRFVSENYESDDVRAFSSM